MIENITFCEAPMYEKALVSFIPFFVFGDIVTKIQKYYAIFVHILQGKMGKTEKNLERKSRNLSDQNTKNQKTKIWDKQNI